MPPDDERHLPEDIFHDALPMDGTARTKFLNERCGDDVQLRAEIEQLLSIADEKPELLDPPGEFSLPRRLGRYELKAECGRGGMGVVYEAQDTQLHRRVALKVLPAHLAGDGQRLEAFRREARTLASLNHDRIATLHSLEESDGVHFLTMEFIEGETLADLLQRDTPNERRALEICRDIASALEAAHGQGIIHRDLKPANIMITTSGAVKVLDFGIARTAPGDDASRASLTKSEHTTSLGTPAYMSPEQGSGETVDLRTDLWSFGCILYECLTGHPVFRSPEERRSAETTLAKLEIPRSLSAPITDVLRSCLTVAVDERIESGREVRQRLEGLLSPRGQRRRVWAVVALSVVALAMLAVAQIPSKVRLASIEIQDQRTLRAIDAAGETVWVHQFRDRIGPNDYKIDEAGYPVSQPQTIVTEKETPAGVVLATIPETSNGTLWHLDASDGSEIWSRPASWTSPVNERGPVYYRWNTVVEWPDRVEPAVATLLRDNVWYGSAVQFLSLANEPLGMYYHPGPLLFCCQLPADDGVAPIVLYGTNSSARFLSWLVPFESRAHCGVAILLDPRRVDGQAFPYSEGQPVERDWPDVPRAHEKAYLVIPPLDPDLTPRVVTVRARPSERDGLELEVITSDHRVFRTDADLRPRWCFVSPEGPVDRLRQEENPVSPVLYIQDGMEQRIDVPLRF